MAESGIRQVIISKMIPTAPRSISTAEIHDRLRQNGFYVTKRTIQRDLNDLSTIVNLRCSAAGRTNRWFMRSSQGMHSAVQD